MALMMLVGGIAALALLPASAGGAGQQSAANSTEFRDSTGEDPAGPDISTVVVSNNDAGLIKIQINIPNRPTMTPDMLVAVLLDTDNNVATGAPPLGLDYAIQLDALQPPTEVNLFRWDGTDFTRRPGDPPATSLIFSYANGATIEINALELGNTKRFKFAVSVVSGLVVNPDTGDVDDTNAHFDAAPSAGGGLWEYEVKLAPLRLLLKTFNMSPAKPKAGKPFTVRLVATRSDTGAVLESGQVTCTANIAGKTLQARTRRVVSKAAVCAYQIPASAKGKTIRGTITLVFEGLRVTRSFVAKIG